MHHSHTCPGHPAGTAALSQSLIKPQTAQTCLELCGDSIRDECHPLYFPALPLTPALNSACCPKPGVSQGHRNKSWVGNQFMWLLKCCDTFSCRTKLTASVAGILFTISTAQGFTFLKMQSGHNYIVRCLSYGLLGLPLSAHSSVAILNWALLHLCF